MALTIRGRGYPLEITATDTTLSADYNGTTIMTIDLDTSPYVSIVGGLTETGDFQANEGTVAAPSISFTGDTNTGLFNPAANTIGVATNGATAMYIDASNVVAVLPLSSGSGRVDSFVSEYLTAAGATLGTFTEDTFTPTTSGDPAGTTVGTFAWDEDFIYVKTVADSGWKRAAIAGW